MSKIDLVFAEIHAPLFLLGDKGKNLGTKLDVKAKAGLKLVYDRDEKELHVSYMGMNAIVPVTNVASMLEAPPKPKTKLTAAEVKEAQKADTPTGAPKPFDPNAAQVSTPQSHVHAGPGAGQTGQESPKERKK